MGSKSGKHPQKRNFTEPAQLNIDLNAEKFEPPPKWKSAFLREFEEQSEEERLRAQEEEEIEEIMDPQWEKKIQEYNLQPVSYTSHVYTWRRDKFEPPSGNGLEFWQGNNEQGEGIFSSAISKHNPKKHDVFRSVAIDCTVHFHFTIDNKDRTKIFRIKQIPTEFTLKNGCLKYYDFRLHL